MTIHQKLKQKLLFIPSYEENSFQYTKQEDDHKGRSKEWRSFEKRLNRSYDVLDKAFCLQLRAMHALQFTEYVLEFALNDTVFDFIAKEYAVATKPYKDFIAHIKQNRNDEFIKKHNLIVLTEGDLFKDIIDLCNKTGLNYDIKTIKEKYKHEIIQIESERVGKD